MVAAKDPSPHPECACTEEPTLVSSLQPLASAETLAPSSPDRPATSPPSHPSVL